MNQRTVNIQADQITSAFINQINSNRFNNFVEAIHAVESELGTKLAEQDVRMLESLSHLEVVRNFVNNPNSILGSMDTKHGEIAEQVEVGIRNARSALRGKVTEATFDGVGRTAPEDYRIGDLLYQSKFINGSRNTLEHIIDHMEKYEDFKLGDNTKYHIPRDQYEMIKIIIDGKDVDGIHSRTISALKDKIDKIEEITGKDFFNKIELGDSSYAEVQIGKVGETLNNHENDLTKENMKIKENFEKEAQEKADSLEYLKEPTVGEAIKAGAIGAGVAATMKLGFSIYSKYKNEDKRIYEYTTEDWKTIGVDVGKSAIKGGVTGTGVYALTNFAMMPAPVAGGYVSATFSAIEIINKYNKGEIEMEDLLVESEVVCVEAGLAMTCALIGQAVIPVPIVGSVIGSVVGSMVAGPIMDKVKNNLNDEEQKLIEEYHLRYKYYVESLEEEESKHYCQIMSFFGELNELEDFVFDNTLNTTLRLVKSAEIADKLEVNSELILRSVDDVDKLFL